jgi:thiamine biosynthesis protein ThiC
MPASSRDVSYAVTAEQTTPAAVAAAAACRYDQFALSLDPVTARSYHDATLPQVRRLCSSAVLHMAVNLDSSSSAHEACSQ